MGKNKQPELPKFPSNYINPLQQGDTNYQSTLGHDLTSGNFSGNLSWLNPTMNINNGANALAGAQGLLQPQFRDTLQQINNQAAANGQLNSSTYTDALARSQSDLNSQYQSILSNQAINDTNQSNSNRLQLFGSGLDTLQRGIGNEQQDTGQQNSYNMEKYNADVASALYGYNPTGGLFGGLSGAAGGGALGTLAGAALALPTGGLSLGAGALFGGLGGAALGGGLGAFSPASSNIGGNLLGAGVSAIGSAAGGALANPIANSRLGFSAPSSNAFASNNPFGNSGNQFGYNNNSWDPNGANYWLTH